MLRSLLRTLTIVLIAMGVSAPLASANLDGEKSAIVSNKAADSILTFCLISHSVKMCRVPHWHGSNQLLASDSPRPQPPGELLGEEIGVQIHLNQKRLVTDSVVYSENHSSLPALYLTTLRLRL